jgi:hypothetical protein
MLGLIEINITEKTMDMLSSARFIMNWNSIGFLTTSEGMRSLSLILTA